MNEEKMRRQKKEDVERKDLRDEYVVKELKKRVQREIVNNRTIYTKNY